MRKSAKIRTVKVQRSTSEIGTFETCRRALRMSALRGFRKSRFRVVRAEFDPKLTSDVLQIYFLRPTPTSSIGQVWTGTIPQPIWGLGMRRREFIVALGGAALVWPGAATAQQPATPVIGFLGAASASGFGPQLDGFRKGLAEGGFSEGRNVAIEYRWADNQSDRLAALAAKLVGRRINMMVAAGRRRQSRPSLLPQPHPWSLSLVPIRLEPAWSKA